jgi:Fe-S cluster assembly protein SufD
VNAAALKPTPTETAFARAFAALGADKTRSAAYEAFAASGLPHRRVEGWRWTDLRAALREELTRAPTGEAGARDPFEGLDAYRLTFVNGWLAASVADAPGLDFRRAGAAAGVMGEGGPAAALARALADDPVEIVIDPGVALERPLIVRHVANGARAFHHERLRLVVREGARVSLLESFEAEGAEGYANALLEIDVAPGAAVEHVVIQSGVDAAVLTSTALVRLRDGAAFNQSTLAFGAKLVRLETQLAHEGEGSRAVLDGAYLLDGARHADQTTIVTHAAEGAITQQLVKGAVRDRATGVFQGRFVVARGAQKTDARMGHHALLLTEGATVNAKPELEIYADDVQCAHGNTAGALDPAQIFYLQSRGLPESRAKALVTEAFVAEAFDRVSDARVRELLLLEARAWLGRALA